MTDPDVPDREQFDALDRRAADAIGALDREVERAPIPDTSPAAGGRRRTPILLAVAALIVVALIGGAVLLTGGDEETTVAGQPDLTHLVLEDPDAAGLELSAAFDGTQEVSTGAATERANPRVTVQGPSDADDPWAESIVESSFPGNVTTGMGEQVDIGVNASFQQTDGTSSVAWQDGERVRHLISRALGRQELLAVATDAVDAETPTGSALPDHEILHTGTYADIQPTLGAAITPPQGFEGVAYRSRADESLNDGGGLIIASVRGGEDRWRATTVLSPSVEMVTVRGREARIGTFQVSDEVIEVSWLDGNGTLIRINAFGLDRSQVRTLLDSLVEIDAAAFAQLVEDHPLRDPSSSGDDGATSESAPATSEFEDVGEPIEPDASAPTTTVPGGQVESPTEISSARSSDGDTEIEARLARRADGTLLLELEQTGALGGSAAGRDVDSSEAGAALRLDLHNGRVAFGGIIGPSNGRVTLRSEDGSDLDPVAVNGPSTTNIAGSEHVVFLLTVPADVAAGGVVAVTEGADGSEVTVPL